MNRKNFCLSLTLMLATAGQVFAANTVTFYRDGALFQREATAQKGVAVIPLTTDILENTISVIPAAGTSILSVETARNEAPNRTEKELELLAEQRKKLEDRLQVLDAREAIFTTAAKSQSGKAPRKTKANPDPLHAIRQGTDFAIAQLETVYTARRRTNHEIRTLDARIAASKKSNRISTSSVRIVVSPPNGKITLRYATTEHGWQPQYNLHPEKNGTARLQFSARVTETVPGYNIRVSPGLLAEHGKAETVPAESGSALIARYHLPLADAEYSEGIYQRFSGRITNSSSHYLPPGESGLYRDGVYMGKFRFEGISSGRSRVISLGK